MKKIVTLILVILSEGSLAQNLVPNASFEDTVYCPYGLNQFEACDVWQNFGNSPDYFNSCSSTPGMSPPNLAFCFQNTHSGKGMAGVVAYAKPGLPGTPNYREFIGVQLTQPLDSGIKYFITIYVNFSFSNNHPIAVNKLGARFSTVSFDSCCPPPINNFAHVYTDSILKDSVTWIKIQGTILADSSYNFLSVGNFFDDIHTDTLILSASNYDVGYYLIDDICVSTDSLYCEVWTDIKANNNFNSEIIIFPNPSNKVLVVKSRAEIFEISIFNSVGNLCYSKKNLPKENALNIEFLQNGFYIVLVRTSKKIIYSKLQIIH